MDNQTCSSCENWSIIPSHGSNRGDAGMEAQGWKNCKANPDHLAYAMFYSGDAKACDKWSKK